MYLNPLPTEQPAPAVTVLDHLPEPTVSSAAACASYIDLITPGTDAIQLCTDDSTDITTDLNFESLIDDCDDLPPQHLPTSTLSDPLTHCLDELPTPVISRS